MDWDALTPLGVFLGIIGGGIAWAVDKWTGRTDKREEAMIATLKTRAEEAEARAARIQAEADLWETRALAWWQQLVKAGIDPVPPIGEAQNER